MKVLTYFDHSTSSFVSSFFSALVLFVVLKSLDPWGEGGAVWVEYPADTVADCHWHVHTQKLKKKKEKKKEENAYLCSGCLSLEMNLSPPLACICRICLIREKLCPSTVGG